MTEPKRDADIRDAFMNVLVTPYDDTVAVGVRINTRLWSMAKVASFVCGPARGNSRGMRQWLEMVISHYLRAKFEDGKFAAAIERYVAQNKKNLVGGANDKPHGETPDEYDEIIANFVRNLDEHMARMR